MIAEATLANPALGELADDANAAHAACEQASRTALTHAYDAGAALVKAKAQLRHGHFTDWVQQNCRFTMRTAQRYMKIFENWERLLAMDRASGELWPSDSWPTWLEPGKATRVSFLDRASVREALHILCGKEQAQQPVPARATEQHDPRVPFTCAECSSPMMTTPSKYLVCEKGCGRLIGTMAKSKKSDAPKVVSYYQLVDLFLRLDHRCKLAFLDNLSGKCERKVQRIITHLIQEEKTHQPTG